MNIGIVGSTGYIAQFLIEHFETCSNIAKVVKFDKSDLADIYLDLQDCEKFNFDLLDGLSYLFLQQQFLDRICVQRNMKCAGI